MSLVTFRANIYWFGTTGEFFYNVKNGSLFIMSKSLLKNLSNENKTHSMFSENWHFSLRFVLMTTKTPVFYFITEILCQTFWRNKWRSVFDVVKNLCLCDFICNSCSSTVTIFKNKYFLFMNLQVFCLVLSFFVSLFFKSLKVHIFWEGQKILRNLHLTFVLCSAS